MHTWIFHTAFHSKSQCQQEMSCPSFQALIPRALRSSLDLPWGWAARGCHPLGKFFWYRPWILSCWWVQSTGWCHNVPCQAPLGCSTAMACQGFTQLPRHWPLKDTTSSSAQPRTSLCRNFSLKHKWRSPVTESVTESGSYWVAWRKLNFNTFPVRSVLML